MENTYAVFDMMMEGVQVINKDWKYIYLNDVAVQHSGLSRDQLISHTPMELYPDIEKTELFFALKTVMDNRLPQSLTTKFDYQDGSCRYFNYYVTAITEGILIQSFDITKEKTDKENLLKNNLLLEKQTKELLKQSQSLDRSMAEKIELIKEVHHRVKNNLQIIISLLHLQSNQYSDKPRKLAFESFEDKISAIALVHHLAYSKGNLVTLNIEDFITLFYNYMIAKYHIENINLEIDINLINKDVNMDTAISFGLLLNEILTNALRHGCPKGNMCQILLDLKDDGKNNFTLKIGDKGNGISKEILEKEKSSLGLSLIEDLVNQLEGKYQRVSDEKGTSYIINFKAINTN